ncbi:MAG: DUF115 domain-containing protein [Planctomycetes bacterium]|nr:DUF115 domain-containing protein [Planctomycetota bacterium]
MKRAYVIGNGPSLNDIDIKKLASETTMSFNRAHIAYEEWGFYPTYYMCIDGIVLGNIKDDINRLIKHSSITHFFLPDWIRPSIIDSNKVTFIHLNKGQFFGTGFDNLSVLGNVGACSTQVLNILGYNQIVLLGTDCRYEESDLECVEIEHNPDDKVRRIVYKSKGDCDPNHFRPDYFGAGCEYGKPQQQNHFKNWKYLSEHASSYDVEIISSSPNSNLNTIFPYLEFETIVTVGADRTNVLNKAVSVIDAAIDGRWCGFNSTKFEYCRIVDEVCRDISQPCVFVEIGTLHGGSAIAALIIAKLRGVLDFVKVVCIDPFEGYYKAGTPDVAGQVSVERTKSNLRRFGFDDRNFELITEKSNAVDLSRFTGKSIKLLFIDGDHSYEGVKYDWEHYGRLVDDAGVILFDNYADRINPSTGRKVWPDVKRFVDNEIIPNKDVNIRSSNSEIMVTSWKRNDKSAYCAKSDLEDTPHIYLFMPSNDTHVHYMLPVAERMQNAKFMVRSKRRENSDFYLGAHEKDFTVYRPGILKAINPSVVVLGIDWGPEEKQVVEEAKQLGIPTVCIQEGCLDFMDQRTNRLMRSDYVFLQGPIMRKYIRRQNGLIVTGNPKYDILYEEPLPEKVKVMINVNFTYKIFEEARDQWAADAVRACNRLGIDFFVSQHPRDNGVFPPEYRVIKSDAFKLRKQLEQSSILISRFSTVIYEALAMGRETVYYNPHGEPFRIFAQDDTGGIWRANNHSELVSSISSAVKNLGSNKTNRDKFLEQHCGTLNHDATDRCAENLRRIANSTTRQHAVMKPLVNSAEKPSGERVDEQRPHDNSNTSKVRISVVVATHRRPDYLTKLLNSLSEQTLGKEYYEVIVVDNNSQDNTKEVVAGYPSFRYIFEEKLGLSYARNTGIRAAVGDIVAFIDDDSEADPGWLQALLDIYDKYPDTWAVGGKILLMWDVEPPEWLTEEYYSNLGLWDQGDVAGGMQWPKRLAGSNCSFQKDILLVLGCFKPELGRVGCIQLAHEETEVQKRIYQTGHTIYYNPEAIVYHHVPASKMNKAYFVNHSLGNLVSRICMALCDMDKADEVRQFVNRFRDIANNSTPESAKQIEEQLLNEVYSNFLRDNSIVPVEMKEQFFSGVIRYYVALEEYDKADKKCNEWLDQPNISESQRGKLRLRLANIYLEQNKIELAHKILHETLHENLIADDEAGQTLKAFGRYYRKQGQFSEFEKMLNAILASQHISEHNRVIVIRCFCEIYVEHQMYKEAEHIYLSMFPLSNLELKNQDKLLLGLGKLYTKCGRYSKARTVLNKAVEVEVVIAREESKPQQDSSISFNSDKENICDKDNTTPTLLKPAPESGKSQAKPESSLSEPQCQNNGYDIQFLTRKHGKWRELKDAFKGKRAFLIGNGPSLNETPLYLLKDEFTLCFNRFNLMFERLAWKPTMYMAVDERVPEDNADEINEMSRAARFVFVPDIHPNGVDFRRFVEDGDNVYWLTLDWDGFSRELPYAGLGGTVANVGLQVLSFMGFSPIYLVGVDMDYLDHATAIKHDARDWTSTQDDDPNHFDPRYFGRGKKYHYPRLHENMLPSMKLARQETERMGVRVINASVGGKLEVFPREDFGGLFSCTEKEKLSSFVQSIPGVQRSGDYSTLAHALPEATVTNSEAEFAGCQNNACIVPVRIAGNIIFNHIKTHIPFGPCDGKYVFVRRPEHSTESERIDLLYDQIRANSHRLLMQYKDKYRGQRCVIIGNGPSLNNTDLSLLKNEYTFGLNKIHLLFDRVEWRPSFYVSVNPFVIQQSAQQILNEIPGLKFLDFVSFKYLPYNENTVHLLSLNGKGFSTDPSEGVFQMHTVTYVAMQLAYYLGFDEVFLVGVDHSFNAVNSGQPDQVVVQNDYDTDHFDPNYFAKGQQWNLPNLKGSEEGYRIAKTTFEKANKKIYDATAAGRLSVFEKVDFYRVFGSTKNSNLHACTGSG